MEIHNKDLRLHFRLAGRCEWPWCARPNVQETDPAHFLTCGAGQVDFRCNILSLCRWDHSATEGRPEDKAKLLKIIATREQVAALDIEPVIQFVRHQLHRLDNSSDPHRLVQRVHESLLTTPQRKLLAVELSEAVKMGATTDKAGLCPLEWPLCRETGFIVGLCGCREHQDDEPCF